MMSMNIRLDFSALGFNKLISFQQKLDTYFKYSTYKREIPWLMVMQKILKGTFFETQNLHLCIRVSVIRNYRGQLFMTATVKEEI